MTSLILYSIFLPFGFIKIHRFFALVSSFLGPHSGIFGDFIKSGYIGKNLNCGVRNVPSWGNPFHRLLPMGKG